MSATARAPRIARGLARNAFARHAGSRGLATATADDTPGGIFKSSVANKTGLSHALDAVMREGHHDMRAFGRGTLAALASRSAYAKFTAAHYHFYCELERRLDDAARGPKPTPSGILWRRFSEDLRRAPALQSDLVNLLDTPPGAHPITEATASYMRAIDSAAEREYSSCGDDEVDSTPTLIAHFYTRYLADLFGGSMLGWPTKRALGLRVVPGFYTHDIFEVSSRSQYVEAVYEAINETGAGLSDAARVEIVREARDAFGHNARIFAEGSGASLVSAAWGGARVIGGYAAERVWGAKEQRDLFGRLVKRRDPVTGKFS
jgi:heme oxygenase